MKVPRHIHNFVANLDRCRRCRHICSQQDLDLIGIRQAKAGRLYLVVDIQCPRCGAINRTADPSHDMAGTDWWKVIGERHDAAITEMGPFDRKNPAGRPQLILKPRPTAEFYITLGIKGEGSQRYFEFRTTAGDMGTCRLTRSNRAYFYEWNGRRFPAATDWLKISHNPEGSEFAIRGKFWRRMTRAEIQQIVQDRVFLIVQPKSRPKPAPMKRRK